MHEVWVETEDDGDVLFFEFEDERTALEVASALEEKLGFLYSWTEEV